MLLLSSCHFHWEKHDDYNSGIGYQLDSLIRNENRTGHFSGTITVGNRDSVLYEKALGLADRVWNIKMDHDYRFDIASVNKSFIAALILKARDEGLLSLDDPLADHLKKYDYKGKYDPNITLAQMLSHRSGLPDYDAVATELKADGFRRFKRRHFSNAEYVDFISQLNPVAEPNTRFYYSNFAYHLLAIILEDTYQKPFPAILKEKIADPLSLHHTFSAVSNREVHQEVVEAYTLNPEDSSWLRNNFIDLTLGRRIFSTSEDLYHWGLAMNKPDFLSAQSRKEMQTNHLEGLTQDFAYGYGWVVYDGQHHYAMGDLGIDDPYIIHGGSTDGYKSMLVNINQGQWVVAFLSNIGNQTNEMQLVTNIVKILNENKQDHE